MYQEPKKGRGKQIAFYLPLNKKPCILSLWDENSHESMWILQQLPREFCGPMPIVQAGTLKTYKGAFKCIEMNNKVAFKSSYSDQK